MSQTELKKLNEVLSSLARIEEALKIVPDRDDTITDFEASIESYEEFALVELKLEQATINNHKSAILSFLDHSKGSINKQTVKEYLASNDSQAWKSNHVKALRRYIRDFLQLGNWVVKEFKFSKGKVKIKKIPNDEQFVQFLYLLTKKIQLVFLVMHNSGLRINEVLSLRLSNIGFESHMIDASNIHKKMTKSSWISYVTKQTADLLDSYTMSSEFDFEGEDPKLFPMSSRAVQDAFKKVSEEMGISVTPHLLRTVFAEKCREAEIDKDYIDAFCGRISQSVLAEHYTSYSPQSLKKQYDKVEPLLTFDLQLE